MKIKMKFLIVLYLFVFITKLSLTEDTKTSVSNLEGENTTNFQTEIKSTYLTEHPSEEIDRTSVLKDNEYKREPTTEQQKYLEDDEQQNIIGGFEAKLGWYPYQVALLTKSWLGESFYCGGSIIATYYVLTAAHCVAHRERVKIVGGIISLKKYSRTAQVRNSKYIVIHERYDHEAGDSAHDISLIVVDEPFYFNNVIRPVDLPTEPLNINNQCVVSGWGATNPEHTTISDRLKAVYVQIREGRRCKNLYRYFVEGIMICSGFVKGNDFCFGDSGGPLVCDNNEQHGIVSFFLTDSGNLCGEGGPQIYTKVYRYKPWIKYHMQQISYRKDGVSTANIHLNSNSIHLIRLSLINAFILLRTIFKFVTF